MRRRSILGLVGAFAASALPFGLHTAEADGKTRPGGAVTFFKWVPTVSGTTILTRDATEVQVVNTTTETELFSYELPAGVLGSDRALHLQIVGVVANPAATVSQRFRLKLGSTTLIDSGTWTVGDGLPVVLDVFIAQLGVASQLAYGQMQGTQSGTSSEDESTALTLTVTDQLGSAVAANGFTKKFASIELI